MAGGLQESVAGMKILAITGCNGSGKTTLFRELPLLYKSHPRMYLIGGNGIMGGTDALSKKDFWMILDWAAGQTRHESVIFEGIRWGRKDLGLPQLEEFCARYGYELWLGWMDAPVGECFQRVNNRKSNYRISLPGLTEQREKILQTVAEFPRVLKVEDLTAVDEWLKL
jgi:hypothetical protein